MQKVKRSIEEFKELTARYSAEAKALGERRQKLIEEIKRERDTERLKELELRKSTIEAERYEVLADMRSMISYVRELENCQNAK